MVDEDGRGLGIAGRDECHRGDGLLHSAFLAMIFDRKNRLLQAQRSGLKRLWPHHWDGTVAGHFSPGEAEPASIRRRIREEVGLDCPNPKYLFRFIYMARYGDIGAEREVCHVYVIDHLRRRRIPFNPAEVAKCRFLEAGELARLIERDASVFTPWFRIAFRMGKENGSF
jgi:isopentenyl-diphosphate Delta-isomerase